MAEITIMTADDIGFAIAMTDSEHWGNAPEDFARLISLEPEGCFVARENDQKVGMITTTTYTDYAFMGSLIIRPEYRRRGIGEALMRHGIEYLHKKSLACIELDATFEGVPLYRKLGFRDKYLSLRLRRAASGAPSPPSHRSGVTPDEVLSLDRQLTGLDRSDVLRHLINEFNNSAYVIQDKLLKGFAIVFPRAGKVRQIGPIIAESVDVAAALISDIVYDNAGHDLIIGLPESSRNLTEVLLEHGFEYREPSLRMYLGEKRDYESSIYGIISPEKG